MPIYEFRCGRCGQTYEHFYMPGEVASGVACPICGVNCPKVPSSFRPDTFGTIEAERASRASGLDIQSRGDLKRAGVRLVDRKEWREMKEEIIRRQDGQQLSKKEIQDGIVTGMKKLENRDYVREVNTKLLESKREAAKLITEGKELK